MKETNGVFISQREMYDLLLKISDSHKEILSRLKVIEDELRSVHKTDERSRQALDAAEEADRKAEEAKVMAEKLERQLFWLWRTLVATVLAAVADALLNILHH